jgi:hypothetical protein
MAGVSLPSTQAAAPAEDVEMKEAAAIPGAKGAASTGTTATATSGGAGNKKKKKKGGKK